MSQQDQRYMVRGVEWERSATRLHGEYGPEGETPSQDLLSEFAESRMGAYAPDASLVSLTLGDGSPRDFIRDIAEELADARNYLLWGIWVGCGSVERLESTLRAVVAAWTALGCDREELGLVEAVKIPVVDESWIAQFDRQAAAEKAELDAIRTAQANEYRPAHGGYPDVWSVVPSEVERGCWPHSDAEGPAFNVETNRAECCLRGVDDRGAALCEEDARLEADSYVEALGWEMDRLAKVEAFADAGARSIEEDLGRLNEAARDLHSIDLLSGLTPLRRRPRVGERVRTALQPGDKKYGIHGQEGKVVDVDRERPRRANLKGEFTHKVRFDFDPKVEQWFTPDELVVLP